MPAPTIPLNDKKAEPRKPISRRSGSSLVAVISGLWLALRQEASASPSPAPDRSGPLTLINSPPVAAAASPVVAIPGGVGVLRRLVTIDLPRLLSRRLPRPVTELAVGIGVTALFIGIRLAISPLLGEVAPFALGITAVVLAALLGGWRSGLVSMVLGTALIWYLVLPPHRSFALEGPARQETAVGTCTKGSSLASAIPREVRPGAERNRRQLLGMPSREGPPHRTIQTVPA